MIVDRFTGASDGYLAAETIIDELSHNGGLHLYEKYLQTKDTSHCSYRLIQFFEEGVQFSFFPGDPGEDEECFDDNWTADQEPDCAEIDHWATRIVKTKQVVKVENQLDDAPSSVRSKRAPSIASSRKTFKMRNQQQRTMTSIGGNNARLDSEQKSRQGDSVRERSERRGDNNNQLNLTFKDSKIESVPQYQLIPLDVEPPREIPEEEKLLRDRKDKQLKMKELEMKEQREKEERERLRMKNKLDAFAEIEKSEYTYDHNGKIIMVKKPNLQRIPGSQLTQPDIQLHGDTVQSTKSQVPLKSRTRLQSAKQQVQIQIVPKQDSRKEESIIQEKAEQELQDNYDRLFNQQEMSLKEYGLQKDPLNVQAGIVLTDKEGRRTKGPNIPREGQMTLQEYQKVASQFEIMNEEKLSKYGSQKKLQSIEVVTQLDEIQEDEDSIEIVGRRSQERIRKKLGADEVYDREISINEYKMNLKAKRKDLKSANIKNVNEKVLERHNKEARITSAKQQQDVRIRRTPSKLGIKERIFNYENHIGGHDMQSNHFGSQISDIRPSSSMMPVSSQSKKNLLNVAGKKNQAESLIDEFNKKLLDKGTDQIILPNDLPKAKQYLIKKQERPMTSKPVIMNKNKITTNYQTNDPMGLQSQSILGGRNTAQNNQNENISLFNNKTVLQKKAPRERIISAKLPKEHDKLPPPPFGKTMGHGLISNNKN